MAEKSITYRLLKKLGLNFSEEEYGQISIWGPMLWRWIGAKVGKNAFIGYEVWMDLTK